MEPYAAQTQQEFEGWDELHKMPNDEKLEFFIARWSVFSDVICIAHSLIVAFRLPVQPGRQDQAARKSKSGPA